MILLNQIDESKRNDTLNLIRDKSLDLKIIANEECYELYYQTFRDLKKICRCNLFFVRFNFFSFKIL